MSTPPPLPSASDWDVPSIRIVVLALTLPAAAKAIGGRGLGLALALGATVLNAIIFLALTSSYAADAR